MPPEKTWIHRVSIIQQALSTSNKRLLSRLDIEDLFQVSRRRAHTLMREIGQITTGPRRSISVPRPAVLNYLRRLEQSPTYEWALNRKDRLTRLLKQAEGDVKQRRVEVRVNPRVYLTRFANLEGVLLSPGRLEITFQGSQDLLQKLAAFSQAIANEYTDFLKRANGDQLDDSSR